MAGIYQWSTVPALARDQTKDWLGVVQHVSQRADGCLQEAAILDAATRHISAVFLSQTLLLLPDERGNVVEKAGKSVTYLLDTREQAVAQWVFDYGRRAGKTTDTLSAAKGLYIPLKTSRGIVGFLEVHPADPQLLVSPERMHLLEEFGAQIGVDLATALTDAVLRTFSPSEGRAEGSGTGGPFLRADLQSLGLLQDSLWVRKSSVASRKAATKAR